MTTLQQRQRRFWELAANASPLGQRMALGALMGVTHQGARDIYGAAGYKLALTFKDYYAAYTRGDIAHRIVRALPDETWRSPPEVLDGADPATAKSDTPFCAEWQRLAAEMGVTDDAEAGKGLLHYLHRADRVSGIGRYGVLFLGFRDGLEASEAVAPNSLRPGDLLYASVFDEGAAQIVEVDDDPQSARFGLPLAYRLTTAAVKKDTGDALAAGTTTAHWTRCIHVVEDTDGDDLYGRPRLEAVWNRLTDMLKILAASGEAAWKLLDSGLILRTTEGAKLPESDGALADLEDQADEFVHGLRRWLLAEGIEAQSIGGQVADPRGLFDINMTLLAATTGIPERILRGAERGELASSQDEDSWARLVETRQHNYAGPQVLRPVVRRLIWAGVLPRPASGAFCARWEPVTTKNRLAEAQTAVTAAQALAAAGIGVQPEVFLETYLPDVARGYEPGLEPPQAEQPGQTEQPPAQDESPEEAGPETDGQAVNALRAQGRLGEWPADWQVYP